MIVTGWGLRASNLRPLDLGTISAPHSMWESGGDSEPMGIPVTAWLISHPNGKVLFDTGMHTDLTTNTPKHEEISVFIDLQVDKEAMVSTRLQALDTAPEDVTAVVASHLHWDHVGGLAQLPEARLIVQRTEWESADDAETAAARAYQIDEYQTGHDVDLIDGEHDVFGDGLIRCIPTPGHTAGHQSLAVRTEAAEILLTGDCCYFEQTIDGGALPPFAHDLDQQARSVDLIRSMRNAGAVAIPAHDPDYWSGRPDLIG